MAVAAELCVAGSTKRVINSGISADVTASTKVNDGRMSTVVGAVAPSTFS